METMKTRAWNSRSKLKNQQIPHRLPSKHEVWSMHNFVERSRGKRNHTTLLSRRPTVSMRAMMADTADHVTTTQWRHWSMKSYFLLHSREGVNRLRYILVGVSRESHSEVIGGFSSSFFLLHFRIITSCDCITRLLLSSIKSIQCHFWHLSVSAAEFLTDAGMTRDQDDMTFRPPSPSHSLSVRITGFAPPPSPTALWGTEKELANYTLRSESVAPRQRRRERGTRLRRRKFISALNWKTSGKTSNNIF